MVHVVDGEVRLGHLPRTSDKYKRRPTAFTVAELPEVPVAVEPGRYHLIVSAACPWAHRAALVRHLKGLHDISLSVVSPIRNDDVGWEFATDDVIEKYRDSSNVMNPTKDNATGSAKYLYELYLKADDKYNGNITTPVLFDSKEGKIVLNDSWHVSRYLDRAFVPGLGAKIKTPLYPKEIEKEIDDIAKFVQDDLNNAVYMAGLARSQGSYQEAVDKIFNCLDKLEGLLAKDRYLAGQNDQITIADIQLFVTLVRFDDVYHTLFKCSRRRLSSYYNLSNFVRDVYQLPGVAETVDEKQTKDHYFTTFTSANPKQIVPLGSVVPGFSRPHDRETKFRDRAAAKNMPIALEEEQGDQKRQKLEKGEFVRGVSGHRQVIGNEPGQLKPEMGRYHLYIANNCPWCHGVMVARAVLGLQDVISVDVLFYRRDTEKGWQFLHDESILKDHEKENRSWLLDGIVKTKDSINGHKYAPEIYAAEGSKERSVPILFDKKTNKIVNNESAEIIRMFAQGFTEFHRPGAPELYPEHLASEIDHLKSFIYPNIQNGAYKTGFANSQEAYEKAFENYFSTLDKVEEILSERRFLTGERPTEADIRLFPTICRHDPVYYSRMKLSKKMIKDMPNLQRWVVDMYALPGVQEATNIQHCIFGYFGRTGNNLIPDVTTNDAWY